MGTATAADQANNEVIEREKSESLLGWSTLLVSVLLVCATTVLFVAGQAYRQGYLYQLGFDLTQMPSDFHGTLFWGFSRGMPIALGWMVLTVIVLLAYAMLFWLTGMLWKQARNRWRLLRGIALPSARPRGRVSTHVKLIAGAVLLLPVIYFLWLAHFGAAQFQKAGSKNGKQLIEEFRTDAPAASVKHGTQKIELWFSFPADTIVRGYRLLCTESLCSIYDPDPKVRAIRLVSLENLLEIRVVDRRGP